MEFVVKLRGLPWSTTVEDVMEFLGTECQIMNDRTGVHLVKTSEGRATGEAFVETLTERDMESALRKHHLNMGHRYIEVFKVKKVEMDWILKRARPEEFNGSPGGGPPYSNVHRDGGHGFGGECETYVRLRGLPFECTEDDVIQFFSGLELAPNAIQMVTDSVGKVTGEAYCQFTTREGAEMALQRDRECIGHRYVEIFRVTGPELRTTVHQLVQRTARRSFGNNRPGPYDRPSGREMGLGGRQMPMGLGRGRPSRYFSGGLGNGSGVGGGRFGQDTWNNYANEVGSWNNRGSGLHSAQQPSRHPPPLMPGLKSIRRGGSGIGMGNLGGGSEVVEDIGELSLLMRGLPWSATEADIRTFFAPTLTRGVQIIFDETNRPSGSARAFFASQEDVTKALQKHKDRMGNRYIELFLD